MSDRFISVVLPVYDQADHISEIVEEYETALTGLPHRHELLLVPNGCSDQSESICHALAEQYATVRVVVSHKGGWGRAVKLGLREARGDILCYTNSARTTAEDLLLILLYAVAYPGVIVKADRKIRGQLATKAGITLI